MRDDALLAFVERKCEVLKLSSIWLAPPRMNPRRWLRNFDDTDKRLAALLLDRFVFFNRETTELLLIAAWESVLDGFPKGPHAPSPPQLLHALKDVVFTPVEGEDPNPTDSGYLMCRSARQMLGIPEELVKTPQDALQDAKHGTTVVFIDDFIGNGNQFIETWQRPYDGTKTFESVFNQAAFTTIYISLVATTTGIKNIHDIAPHVAICPAHCVGPQSSIHGLIAKGMLGQKEIDDFLNKYASRLDPDEDYIRDNIRYKKYGFKERGLMLGFEHSIPDATLPIFWSKGIGNWEPLIERA